MSFAQQTTGPATATGENTNIGALIQDRANNITETVGEDGLAQALMSALYVLTAQTALTAITTAQNLFDETLGAQVLNKLARKLRIKGRIIYNSTGAAVATITLAVKFGGVAMVAITTAATNTAASTGMPIEFEFTLTTVTTGTSGTIEAHGRVDANISANTPAVAVATYLDTNVAVSSAVNLNIEQPLLVTIAASAAIPSAQLREMTVEVVN